MSQLIGSVGIFFVFKYGLKFFSLRYYWTIETQLYSLIK
jgi:hypothetical protein